MSEHHSSLSAARSKPPKPYPDFPLFAHANGTWAKKIRGRLHYFGIWEQPDAALAKYNAEKEDLHAGRHPRTTPGAGTVKDVANLYLNAKLALVKSGELSPRTFEYYKTTADLVVGEFGKNRLAADLGPADFATLRKRMAARWGLARLGNTVGYVRGMFKFALESDVLSKPIQFGPEFKKPSKKTMRVRRAGREAKLFAADEIRRLIDVAGTPLKAMILLGINCGFGNTDCGRLPLSALDLDGGWCTYPRPKTGVPRRCALWPETVAALRDALAARPAAKRPADAALAFLTKYGTAWSKDNDPAVVTKEMRKLLNEVGVNGQRNFYTLRHTFRTVADESRDFPAVDCIMGHEAEHMSTVYRERISDERLRAVADYVRAWLFGSVK